MNRQPHPYAQVLRWIADGEHVQVRCAGEWISDTPEGVLRFVADRTFDSCNFRIKPRTVTINDVEIEAPLSEIKEGDVFWYVQTDGQATERIYIGTFMQRNLFNNGRAFATRDAAEAASVAISKALLGK